MARIQIDFDQVMLFGDLHRDISTSLQSHTVVFANTPGARLDQIIDAFGLTRVTSNPHFQGQSIAWSLQDGKARAERVAHSLMETSTRVFRQATPIDDHFDWPILLQATTNGLRILSLVSPLAPMVGAVKVAVGDLPVSADGDLLQSGLLQSAALALEGSPQSQEFNWNAVSEGFWEWVDLQAKKSDVALLALGFLPHVGRLPSKLVSVEDWLAVRLLGTSVSSTIIQKFGGHVSPAMAGRIGGLTTQLGKHTGSVGLLKPIGSVGTWVGVGLSAVVGGVDIYLNQREEGWGGAGTISAEVNGGLATAFSFVPGGALVYSGTSAATGFVYGKADNAFNLSGQVVDDYARRAYLVDSADQLTVAQSDELALRYQGWSGLANATGDGIIGAGRGTGNLMKRAWNAVF